MDSLDNLRERFEALEQRTEHFHQQTRMVERRLRWWRDLACGVLLVGLVSLPLPTGMANEEHADKDNKGLAQRVRKLEAQVKALQATLVAVTFDATTKELVITGANLRIVNGLGRTDCGTEEAPIPDCPNGLGNLIVGYNESRQGTVTCPPLCTDTRTGSHNVVVGSQHNFSQFGGLVVGRSNDISGAFASVSGGARNTASGEEASVSGGISNTASDRATSVSGGFTNTASGFFAASVSGGTGNTASAGGTSVSGGSGNTASGEGAWVGGGVGNTANGFNASVSGGVGNAAEGESASVSGGIFNTASGVFASVSGGQSNTANGFYASVSGGLNRTAEGENDWRGGRFFSDD